MKKALVVIRWIVGLLFIFSGLIKANDPSGLSYKMQEFFDVWGWHFMDDYTLAFSLIMNVFEVVAGIAVIIGWRMPLFSWLLLLLIIFFSFLTGYALLSGKIKTCGCFGDCIPLTAAQSFTKDIILLLLILIIWAYRKKVKSNLQAGISIFIIIISLVGTTYLQYYVLKNLPIKDCLPYAKGKNIKEQMLPPANAIPDSTVMVFIYEKNGMQTEYINDVPEEVMNDSTYIFIDRKDKIVREGNATPAITDLAFYTLDGMDTTGSILSEQEHSIWMFVKSFQKFSVLPAEVDDLIKICKEKNVSFYLVTPDKNGVEKFVGNRSDINILIADAVVVKTAARAIPTFFMVQNGTIHEKTSLMGLENLTAVVQQLK